MTTLACLVQDIPWEGAENVHDFIISRADVEKSISRLAGMSVRRRMSLQGMQPQRADIIVHGMVILLACMIDLEIEQIVASESGNLEGYIKYHYSAPVYSRL